MALTNQQVLDIYKGVIQRGMDDFISRDIRLAIANGLQFVYTAATSTTMEDGVTRTFLSTTERDNYFDPDNLQQLMSGLPIFVQTGTASSPTVFLQVWSGANSPTTYDATDWTSVGDVGLSQFFSFDAAANAGAGELSSSVPFYAPEIRTNTGTLRLDTAIDLQANSDSICIIDNSRTIRHTPLQTDFTLTTAESTPIWDSKGLPERVNASLLQDATFSSGSYMLTADRNINLFEYTIIPQATGTASIKIHFGADTTGPILISILEIELQASDIGNEVDMTLPNCLRVNTGENFVVVYSGPDLAGHQYSGDPIYGNQLVPYTRLRGHPITAQNIATESFVNAAMGNLVSLENFSLNLPSRVDLNTDLGSRTVTYTVTNANQITALQLQIDGTDFVALSNPSSDGVQTESVDLSSVDTTTSRTIVFRLRADDTFNSNTQSLLIRDPVQAEAVYYGTSDSDNDDTIDVSTLTRRDVAVTESFNADFSLPASHYAIILVPNNYMFSAIERTFNQDITNDFTATDDVRVISGQTYDSYVQQNTASSEGVLSTRITITV